MPPKRLAVAPAAVGAAAAAVAPLDTSLAAISKLDRQLQSLKPILYKKDQHAEASAALKQFHQLHVQIQSIYDGQRRQTRRRENECIGHVACEERSALSMCAGLTVRVLSCFPCAADSQPRLSPPMRRCRPRSDTTTEVESKTIVAHRAHTRGGGRLHGASVNFF